MDIAIRRHQFELAGDDAISRQSVMLGLKISDGLVVTRQLAGKPEELVIADLASELV